MDTEGNFWRAISFIHGAQSFRTVKDVPHAREVGHALGMFQYLNHDLPIDRLADTLNGFHIMPRYLQNFDRVRTTVVICASGYRSSIAASLLQTHGFDNLFNVVGGMSAWARAAA